MNTTTPTADHVAILKANLPADELEFLVPDDLAPLADYALVVTFSRNTRDGFMWEGDLYRAGEKVLLVGNDGQGGPDNIYGIGGTQAIAVGNREREAFVAAARKAYPSVKYEPEGAAIGFLDLVFQIGRTK